MLIDSHCHINDDLFKDKSNEYVNFSNENGVKILLVVGYDLKSSKEAINIAEKFEDVYAAIGIIPSEIKNMNDNDLAEIESLISSKKVIAIGEIGLDYHWDKEEGIRNLQKEYFIKQIELANKYNLPVSIHCRDAYEDLMKILKDCPVNKKGIIHCFSGSIEVAKILTKMGYLLGIGGTSTFKNAVKAKEVVQVIKTNEYVLETDAPYLTPEPFRGRPNHSAYLKYVRDNAALLRNETPDKVETDTTNNFKKLFNL